MDEIKILTDDVTESPVVLIGTDKNGKLALVGLHSSKDAASHAVQHGKVPSDLHYSIMTPELGSYVKPRELKTPRRHEDTNQLAKRIADTATEGQEKNIAAVHLGRLGGLKGGKARAAMLSPEERTEIARTAARARWKKE